jgi:hypothetical protein
MTPKTTALAASVIAAIGLVVSIGMSAVPAYARVSGSSPDAGSYPSQVCIASNPGLNQCINNWGGHVTSGNPINYYKKGSGGGYKYNNWDVTNVGTVSTSPAWPFEVGSGLNAKYNGDEVLTFTYQGQYANPTDYCLDSGAYSLATGNGDLKLRGCGGTAFQLYVWTKYSALVSVGASNEGGASGTVVWLGCRALNCANGQPVIASSTQDYNRPFGLQGPA